MTAQELIDKLKELPDLSVKVVVQVSPGRLKSILDRPRSQNFFKPATNTNVTLVVLNCSSKWEL